MKCLLVELSVKQGSAHVYIVPWQVRVTYRACMQKPLGLAEQHSGLHFNCTPTHTLCQWCPYVSLNTTSLHPMDHHVLLSLHLPQLATPSPHPPTLTSTPSMLLVVQYWYSGSQQATLGSEWNRKSLRSLRTSSG